MTVLQLSLIEEVIFLNETTLLATIIASLIASLLSGLIGVIISIRYYRKYENRKQKFTTLRRLAGNRSAIAEGQGSNLEHSREDFFAALNEVFVVFHDSDLVRDALKKYEESKSLDDLISLFKAICKDLKISYEFNDSFFEKPFTPGSTFRGTGSV